MRVLHGWWDGGLVLWAEDSGAVARSGTAARRRVAPAGRAAGTGRRRPPRRHPFAAGDEELAGALADPPDGIAASVTVIELPTFDGAPLASPDLPVEEAPGAGPDGAVAATGAAPDDAMPAPGPELARWKVPAVRLDAAQALPVLLAGAADGVALGADLRQLAAVAALADDLAARGRTLPTVLPARGPDAAGWAEARWRPLLSGSDAARARSVALALPPAARAPGTGARATVTDALDTLTDAAVRARLARRGAGAAHAARPGRARARGQAGTAAARDAVTAWRAALTAPDPRFAARAEQVAELAAQLADWQRDAAGGPVRARFRLLEPPPELVEPPPDAVTAEREPAVDASRGPADAPPAPIGVRPGATATATATATAGAGVDAGQAPWVLEFGLQAADEPSLAVDAARVWRSRGALKALARHVEAPQETLLAELGRALRLYPGLEPALRTARPTRLELDATGAHDFLREAAPSLAAAGFGVLLPSWWGRPGARLGVRAAASTPPQPGGVGGPARFGQEALVEFSWQVALGDDPLTEAELAALVELQQPLVRVRGQWVQLDSQRLRNGLKLVRENASGNLSLGDLLRVVGSGEDGPGGLPVVGVDADGWLGDLLSGTAHARVEPVPVPGTFAGTLRPYQERGLAWLAFLQRLGLGAVLADDMGLGKTVQLLALMSTDGAAEDARAAAEGGPVAADAGPVAADGDRDGPGPTLLVCPMSLVGNWEREAARFTPQLRVHVHHGAERPRGKAFTAAVASSDLVLTTYALAVRDAAALSAVPWRRVVLDEAQAVKNAATKAAAAVRALPARHKIAVTGTPVENRLADLWSLMEFANPGLLGSAAQFKQRFALPVERHHDVDATARLRAVTQPFILRRVKTDRAIIADLPEKLEMEVVCGFTREQASLYQAVVDDMMRRVEESEGMERRGLVLATMTKLKQVCDHPALLLRDGSRLAGRSGKLARLEETLEEVLAAGEKALLFTQFAEFGGMLRGHLAARFGREVAFLHGGVAKADRDVMVSRFQSGEAGAPALFVLSLKAGGTGLTLTAANHVVHVDRWWNPAVEDQATDRAFRIGQTRNVQVRKLVVGGTLEERISAMIRDKRGLAASIVGSGEGWLTELTTEQLRELVRLDAASVVE